ncbi:MAG TPA: nicotinate-nicotinamide nucleotide adenylyltransferase [Candidatus Sulfotelmatobacter sp.]|nr:nicotinate-nicotinamide nucleotide adenylyltransferase [Candidatus Sulfotelmatobacter sp.]
MRLRRTKARRIGIFSGTFNPVHTGHIAFALQAIEQANLDKIYFLPERRPKDKSAVEHYGHRVAMIKQAIKPHPKFAVTELPDISFSVKHTLPKLRKLYPGDQLVLLIGSDKLEGLPKWPGVKSMLSSIELVIGLRDSVDEATLRKTVARLPVLPKQTYVVSSYLPDVSSSKVRDALRANIRIAGVLRSVERYSSKNWLYISLDKR